ncbi:hypothetical protein [Candidatus Albibeggiatoa sp. nov. NOAA]|uniref:hypothetical protein n=1 Tax=Candidatus Albibeggiatoa sp. nov. NOAA TaxID=3162724 RepID=UPI0032F8C1EC|nr:hypothetical protein [Thiotrichaceae bacterium]
MHLSNEDNLRLNVLLANQPQAIRIDESKMIVYGLSTQGEAKVVLHPNCRDELYLKQVRELISERILDSPGGYPVYLRRWSRMGQARDENLAQLLMLGVPEAVEAVVNAQGLTPELAERAWWAMPESKNARSMLERPAIIEADIGKVLAQHLIDYLPFETEAEDIIETVRLVLQADLINEAATLKLWQKGRSKNAYYVGFLATRPHDLPTEFPARHDAEQLQSKLQTLADQNNIFAKNLIWLTSSDGQAFLDTFEKVLKKPVNQDVVNILFDVVADHFTAVCKADYDDEMDINGLVHKAGECCQEPPEALQAVLEHIPEECQTIRAMLILSGLRYSVLRPIFSTTTAIGTLMRKKLAPVTDVLLQQIAVLRDRA